MRRHLDVCGTTVSYERAGSGSGLVLLHGTNADGATSFGHLAPRFHDHRTVIVPDFAGCGASTLPAGELPLDLLVKQVAAVLDDAATGPVDLLGISLGAVVAAAVAAARPSQVRRLVLVAGWSDGEDARHQLVFGTWERLAALDPVLGARFALSLALSPPFLSALGDETLHRMASRAASPDVGRRIGLGLRADIREQLRRITAPTLVVGLTRDHLVPVERSRALYDAIPGSRYAEIDSGHLVTQERPEELSARVREFLLAAHGADRSGAV